MAAIKSASEKKSSAVDRKFAAVVEALSTEMGVTHGGKGFGSAGLKVDGKIFPMVSSKRFFVVKLPIASPNWWAPARASTSIRDAAS